MLLLGRESGNGDGVLVDFATDARSVAVEYSYLQKRVVSERRAENPDRDEDTKRTEGIVAILASG